MRSVADAAHAALPPNRFEVRLDELVEVAVHHPLHVADLQLGAVVVDHGVRLEDVGADLVAPGVVGLGGLDLGPRRLLLLQLPLVERGPQHLHRGRLVLALAPLLLAGDDEPGRDVGEPHRGRGLVDVLAAGARGAEDVHLDVFVAEVDLDRVVDVGIDEHRREGGVPPRLRVERRDAHQPVHALLRLEEAVGVLALDLERDRLDPRLFARLRSRIGDLEAVALGPADVHPHEHLGPVLRLGAAGAGMDGEDGVARVVRALQHGLQLEALDRLRRARRPPEPAPSTIACVRLGLEQLGHRARVLEPLAQISS